jgi:hypothetical protein
MSVLYTILPHEMVFAGVEEEENREYFEVPMQGGSLVLEAMANNQAKIVRVISSDARIFLNPNLQPGSVIEFPYQLKS